MIKTEVLFYYESRQNPNGDPGFDNQPRQMPDETILVTDVRIKRTMRDYAKSKGKTLFADLADDGLPTSADKRAEEIAKNNDENFDDLIKVMLKHTFDVPLFGALVTMRGKDSKKEAGSAKLTGPMQFALARSVNKVDITNHSITSCFVGDEKKGRHTTIGSFYAVDYALIKAYASINPQNLVKYNEDEIIQKNFDECKDMIPDCLWFGTNDLVSRSKYPQRSILYIEINYKDVLYNDIAELITENNTLKEKPKDLGQEPFIFENMIKKLNERKEQIDSIKVRCIDDLDDSFIASLPNATKI